MAVAGVADISEDALIRRRSPLVARRRAKTLPPSTVASRKRGGTSRSEPKSRPLDSRDDVPIATGARHLGAASCTCLQHFNEFHRFIRTQKARQGTAESRKDADSLH